MRVQAEKEEEDNYEEDFWVGEYDEYPEESEEPEQLNQRINFAKYGRESESQAAQLDLPGI